MHSWPMGTDACHGKRFAKALCETLECVHKENTHLNCMYRGAGIVIASHLEMECTKTHIPALFNEFCCPLCDTSSPLRSFVWETKSRVSDMVELTRLLMSSLDMKICEVVLAVLILESLVSLKSGIFQPNSVRPILIASCTIACKVASDLDVITLEVCDSISDCFTNLNSRLLARLEEQLLVLLDWHIPMDPDAYTARCSAIMKEGETSVEERVQSDVSKTNAPAFSRLAEHWFDTPDKFFSAPTSEPPLTPVQPNSTSLTKMRPSFVMDRVN